MVQSGIILVLSGLIKKMVFADRFAVVSDGYFNDPTAHPGWLAAVVGLHRILHAGLFRFLWLYRYRSRLRRSCWALSFRLISRARFCPEIRPTSGRGGI